MSALYQRLGGRAAITAVVQEFYKIVLADSRVNYFFNKVDMSDQTDKQIKYIMLVTGGPCEYKGRGMREAHKGLGIKEHTFMAVVENLIAALKHFTVPQELIDELVSILAKTKTSVLDI